MSLTFRNLCDALDEMSVNNPMKINMATNVW